MTDIILNGCCGKMGHVIQSIVSSRDDCRIVAGVDIHDTGDSDFPVYSSISDIKEKADAVIDFSNPALLDSMLEYGKKTKTPLVIATTGYDSCQKKQIEEVSKECPVFFTYNYSLGVNLLASLAKKAVNILGSDFDIEIIEKHHNQKIDAPSGTALMLADAINEELDNKMKYEYDRHSKREKRSKNEIGIHAVRGGTIVGEHEIMFAGRDEIITLSHSARSKEIFAVGAVNAAVFMNGKGVGMYQMSDL
ncbi:4-hydroxy-tetrahydrodipicolinate reductase, partial [uncultured Eubacterium sp.]|uniref:4-hydroxy-tetrahydrodipicolinate reductase n=1 Tax=uncultured Eubacterium sp. TaxID=165185 RepID=UPI0025CFE791